MSKLSIEEMEKKLNIRTQYKQRRYMTEGELEEHIRLVYKRNNRRAYLRKKLLKQEEEQALEQEEEQALEQEEEEEEEETEEGTEEQTEEEQEEQKRTIVNNYFIRRFR